MLRTLLIPALLLGLALTGCQSHKSNLDKPDSEIVIDAASGGPVISSPENKGAITMTVGQQRHFVIMRTVRTGVISPVATNVTALSDFNFTDPNVASMDSDGNLTALSAGFTTLEVVYREDSIPTNDDKVTLDITVSPL